MEEHQSILYCRLNNGDRICGCQGSRHIDMKYHVIRGFVENGDVTVVKITSEENLANPFTKTLVVGVLKGISRAWHYNKKGL